MTTKGPFGAPRPFTNCSPSVTVIYPSVSPTPPQTKRLEIEQRLNSVIVDRKRMSSGVNVELRTDEEKAYRDIGKERTGPIDPDTNFFVLIELVYNKDFVSMEDLIEASTEVPHELEEMGMVSGGKNVIVTC